MVAIPPDLPAATDDPIHRACDADGESLQSTPERVRIVGLHEKMDVIGLRAEVEKAEARVGGGGERGTHDGKDDGVAQRGNSWLRAERDVDRTAWDVCRTRCVRDSPAFARGLPSGVVAAATPGRT